MTRTLLVPAAGRGTRLASPLPKALTPVAGRAMLDWILDRHQPYCGRVVLVIHPDDRAAFGAYVRASRRDIALAEQPAPTGMLDAILCGRDAVAASGAERVWITWCDQVLISAQTAAQLAARDAAASRPAAVFPTSRQTEPYVHFDRDAHGRLNAVRQRREGDEMPPAGESDAGLFSLTREALAADLPEFARTAPRGRATHERNFLPFLAWLGGRAEVVTFTISEQESLGINTADDLAAAETLIRRSPG
jgi:bifunctional UDP-N-acetylglucosamine pyrophosphorylase/glucosamine-1-phosphate N-acetyltransferase